MGAPKLSGVLPIVPTPFAADGTVDLESLDRLVDYAIDTGARALVYPGVASEDLFLSPDERRICLTRVIERAAGRVPVIAGVNADQPAPMVEFSSAAVALGVDGIMAMAIPAMNGHAADWFAKISDAIQGRPIILQNLFAPRGANLSSDEMIALSAAVPAIRYVKEEGIPSGPKVTALAAGAGERFDAVIGGGGARYLLEELDRGATATMPAIELLELHVRLVQAYEAGDRGQAMALYERSLPLLLIQAPYRMRMTKLILMRRGIIAHDHVREPLPEMDDALKALTMELYDRAMTALEDET